MISGKALENVIRSVDDQKNRIKIIKIYTTCYKNYKHKKQRLTLIVDWCMKIIINHS